MTFKIAFSSYKVTDTQRTTKEQISKELANMRYGYVKAKRTNVNVEPTPNTSKIKEAV